MAGTMAGTLTGELTQQLGGVRAGIFGEFDLKNPRNDMLNSKDDTAESFSAIASSDAMKHFHSAALDYMWRREAQTSKNWRIRLYVLMEVPGSSTLAFGLAIFLSAAIVGQLIVIYLQQSMSPGAQFLCDLCLTVIFTIEVGVRCFAAIAAKQTRSMLASFFFYIDIVSIVPFYVGVFIAPLDFSNDCTWVVGGDCVSESSVLKLLNLLRIIRIFKVTRTYPGAALLSRALVASAPALLVPLAFLILGAAFFGAVYFFFEGLDADNSSLDGKDVGDALWFMIVTFTTVGYGDMYPGSKLGKIVTVLAILCGVIFMAMPITIVGNNFTLAIEEKEKLAVVLSIQQHLIDNHMRADNILDLFKTIDTSGDATIDYKEFKFFVVQLMKGSHVCLKPSSMRRLFAVFDEDGSGNVTCQEFCHLIFPDVDIDTWDP